MTASDEAAIALLRIELEDIEPLIWRRVAVPTSMSLKAVHNVIQAAMGWLDNHLWAPRTMPVSTRDWLSVEMMAVFERDFPPGWLPFVHSTPLS